MMAPLLILSAAVMLAFASELAVGSAGISLRDGLSPVQANILLNVRLPRAITAMLAGAALSCSGLLLQTLFRNPLAGPWALGITSGARLGVGLVVLAGSSIAPLHGFGSATNIGLAVGAFLGSGLLVLLVARLARELSSIALLILGLMIQYAAEAVVSFVLQWTNDEHFRVYVGWADGAFHTATPEQLRVLVPVVLMGLAPLVALMKPLNAMLLGERYAASLGVKLRSVRYSALASTALLAGGVTAFCGPVTFLDLAVPHLARGILRTADHRQLLPVVALLGALIGLMGDFLVHLPWRRHFLHLNYITALIGVPVVLWAVLKQKRRPGTD